MPAYLTCGKVCDDAFPSPALLWALPTEREHGHESRPHRYLGTVMRISTEPLYRAPKAPAVR